MVNLETRFKIVGIEVVFLGAFNLGLVALELSQANGNSLVSSFAWVFIVVGITLILVGLELLSLVRQLPGRR